MTSQGSESDSPSPLRREDWLAKLACHGEEREALVFRGSVVDYARLARAAEETASHLDALGLEAGELVAILAPPSLEGVVLLHAMLARGIVMLPLNARLAESEQLEVITSTRCRFLLVSAARQEESEAREATRGERLAQASGCGLIVSAPPADSTRLGCELRVERPPTNGAQAKAEPLPDGRRARRRAEGAALVLSTSGTSGRAKAAILGFDNLMASAQGSAALLGSGASDRWLLCMPLFHIGGLSILIRTALVGAGVVLHERFEAEAVARALDDEAITRTSFVAAMLARVLDARGERRAPSTLELVLLGGGPASQDLLRRSLALGYPIAPTYGLTEAASQVATRPPGRSLEPGSDLAAGLVPLVGVDVRVVDERGVACAVGEEGAIEVRGPIVMQGYLDDPAATEAALRGEWLATGDVGRLDSRGGLRVLDRRADLILSGGENVYPAEVESLLLEFPGLAEVGVFGIPDAEFGERPAAAIVMEKGVALDRAALAGFCRERMASYKRPVDFVAVDALPRTATGKLLRRELRKQSEQGR